MIVSSSPLPRGARGRGGAARVVAGCGRGQGGRVPRGRPRTWVGPEPPESLPCVVIGPDRPPACRHRHVATVHPAQAWPRVPCGPGPVPRAGDSCPPVGVRLEDRRVPQGPRAGALQAAVTQHPRAPTPPAPLRALGGRQTGASEGHGDRRTAHPTAASGVDPVEADLVRRALVIPRDRSHPPRLPAPPTRPVDRDRAVVARAWDIHGDPRTPHAPPRVPVVRGGRRHLPHGRNVLGAPPDRVTSGGCAR